MWDDILRRRFIHAKNHPIADVVKLVMIACILMLPRLSFCFAFSAIIFTCSVNLLRCDEDCILPMSDREHILGKLEEGFLYSIFYSMVLLLHTVWFLVVVKEPFYVENANYLLLLILFIVAVGTATGFSIEPLQPEKKKRSLGSNVWNVFRQIVGVLLLIHLFFLFVSKVEPTFVFFKPKWYMPTLVIAILCEVIQSVVMWKAQGIWELKVTLPKKKIKGDKK